MPAELPADNSSSPARPATEAVARRRFEQIAAQAQELGFEFCTHGLRLPLPITAPRTVFFSNYPAAWQARYQAQGYLDIDPTVAHGMRSAEPVLWSEALFQAVPELWREAQAHGVCHGWAQSMRDPEGVFSMLVLARSGPAITAEELTEKEEQMKWLVHRSHAWMRACGSDIEAARPHEALSEREVEVLRWSAEGKTSAEIAQILAISERTVNFHVNSAVAKLEASNKTSAAVRAAMLGLLW